MGDEFRGEGRGRGCRCARRAPAPHTTRSRRLPDGETGLVAITHLRRRGTVMRRYLVGDVAALAHAPCPHCGRLDERVVTTPRRTANLVKCRGMLVNTDVILDTLSAIEGIGQFQIVFARAAGAGGMERFVVRLEHENEHTGAALLLKEQVTTLVRNAVSLRPEVEFAPRGAIYDHERLIKAKRILDLR